MNQIQSITRFTQSHILAAVLLTVATAISPAAVWADDRPNIVMAFADDWGKYASAYGKLAPGGINDHVSTPNFDAVAGGVYLFTTS